MMMMMNNNYNKSLAKIQNAYAVQFIRLQFVIIRTGWFHTLTSRSVKILWSCFCKSKWIVIFNIQGAHNNMNMKNYNIKYLQCEVHVNHNFSILNIFIWIIQYYWWLVQSLLVLFLLFRRKTRLIKRASVCVCVKFCPPPTISKPVIRLIQNFGYI